MVTSTMVAGILCHSVGTSYTVKMKRWIGGGGAAADISNMDACKWGLENEGRALEAYSLKTGTTVSKTGLWQDRDYFMIGASPDGVVRSSGNVATCVEVKCPHVLKRDGWGGTISGAVQSGKFKALAAYLRVNKLANGTTTLSLNPKHAYYAQVQIAIRCTRARCADFVVWSEVDLVVIRIEPDESFLAQALPACERFYFDTMLPSIVSGTVPNPLHPPVVAGRATRASIAVVQPER